MPHWAQEALQRVVNCTTTWPDTRPRSNRRQCARERNGERTMFPTYTDEQKRNGEPVTIWFQSGNRFFSPWLGTIQSPGHCRAMVWVKKPSLGADGFTWTKTKVCLSCRFPGDQSLNLFWMARTCSRLSMNKSRIAGSKWVPRPSRMIRRAFSLGYGCLYGRFEVSASKTSATAQIRP